MKYRFLATQGALAAVCAFSLASCGVTKVDQCNSLSTVVNQAKEITKKNKGLEADIDKAFAQAKDSASVQAATKNVASMMSNIKDDITKLSKDLAGVKLQDEKLLSFQTQAVTNYNEGIKALDEMIKGMEILGSINLSDSGSAGKAKAASSAIESAANKLSTMETQETTIAKDFNGYCDAK
jgi:predicted lipase